MKKYISAFLFLLVSLFAFGFNANVKAVEVSDAIIVNGAQVRTTGNAGIRFIATESFEAQAKTAFGIVLAFGEAEADENFVIDGTVNGKAVVKGEVTSTDNGEFMVTLYDVPASMYKQKISARAYVYANDKYVYSKEVCVRSLADVVIKAYEEGDESDFVKEVYELVKPAGTTLYYNAEPQFESFDAFVEELVKDFDVADPAKTVTKETFANQTGTAIKNVFNKVEMINKYRWLLEFLLESMTEACGKKETYEDTYSQTEEMINKILNNDTAAISGSYANARTAVRQVIYALINKTNKGQTSAYNGYVSDFSNPSNYAIILPVFTSSEVVELEENAELPSGFMKNYYVFAGWYDNPEFEGEVVTNYNGAEAYYAKFVPNTYTITYNLQGGSTTAELLNEYTVETETFALPAANTMSIENGEFVGWYNNDAGAGEPVTEITKGTAGNIKLYAVWAMAAPKEVELSAADQTVIAKYNPNKFVYASASAGNYVINGETYKYGEAVFSTFEAALDASSKDDVIYVFAGEYKLGKSITKSLTILGPNADFVSQAVRTTEAQITVTADVVTLNANEINFNGLKLVGSASSASAGIYFQSGSNLKNTTFQSCVITRANTFVKYTTGSAMTVNVLDCHISDIGQFCIWINSSSAVETLNFKGNYLDASNCGKVGSANGAMIRILGGNAYVYNNVLDGDLPCGGYFCNRGTGSFEIKYNTIKNVTRFIATLNATTHTFDNNLYLNGETAAETSPLAGNTYATADTTVCSSAQDLAAKWAEFNK